jgi:hypothetical protein
MYRISPYWLHFVIWSGIIACIPCLRFGARPVILATAYTDHDRLPWQSVLVLHMAAATVLTCVSACLMARFVPSSFDLEDRPAPFSTRRLLATVTAIAVVFAGCRLLGVAGAVIFAFATVVMGRLAAVVLLPLVMRGK